MNEHWAAYRQYIIVVIEVVRLQIRSPLVDSVTSSVICKHDEHVGPKSSDS